MERLQTAVAHPGGATTRGASRIAGQSEGDAVAKLKIVDIVGSSTDTFTDAMRNAVHEAQQSGQKIESIEVGPPWHIVINDAGKIEFRTTVRVMFATP